MDLATGPLMAAHARAAGQQVAVHSLRGATLLIVPGAATDIDNRAFDVDPRAPGLLREVTLAMTTLERRPLLEIDAVRVGEAERAELAALGLARLWVVAELQRALPGDDMPTVAGVSVRDVRLDEADAFGALAAEAYGDPPPGFPPVDVEALRRAWSSLRSIGLARCYLAEIDGQPCSVATSVLAGDVALVDGAATLSAYRGRGCQQATLVHRFREAAAAGARVAVTRTMDGSGSHRNLERAGMRAARRLEVWGRPL